MKEVFTIFVEGLADKRFVAQLLEHLFHQPVAREHIVVAGGWTKLVNQGSNNVLLAELRRTTDNGGINLVIFDADKNCEKRKEEINKWKEAHQVQFDLFLLPDNNRLGDLEDLLMSIINQENQPIMDCWDNYERELDSVRLPWKEGKLTLPAKKTRIYAYLEALLGDSKSQKQMIKEVNRDYLNRNHWNLCAEGIEPLAAFLREKLA